MSFFVKAALLAAGAGSAVSLIVSAAWGHSWATAASLCAAAVVICAGVSAALCWLVQDHTCIVYLNSVIHLMLPGKQGTHRECLDDQPRSVVALRCLHHASVADFGGDAPFGMMVAVSYSDFLVFPVWTLEYESRLAAVSGGLSRVARELIASLAAADTGSALLLQWHSRRAEAAAGPAQVDDCRRDAELIAQLQTALQRRPDSGGRLPVEPLGQIIKRLAGTVEPCRRAHMVCSVISASFAARIAACFCDFPHRQVPPLRWLFRELMEDRVKRSMEGPGSGLPANFEGLSFAAGSPVHPAFGTALRVDEQHEEELPESVATCLAETPTLHRAVAAWLRTATRGARQPLRKESRDVVRQAVDLLMRPTIEVTSAHIHQAAEGTPHRGDLAATTLALTVAVAPKLLTHAVIMAALHEKSALGALHAAAFGAALAAVKVAHQVVS